MSTPTPFQVDHKASAHPPRRDYTYLEKWTDTFLANTAHLGAEIQVAGLTMATQGLDDGTCIHPGAKRLSALLHCDDQQARNAMRILRYEGWIVITQHPSLTSPTVHALAYPRGVQSP